MSKNETWKNYNGLRVYVDGRVKRGDKFLSLSKNAGGYLHLTSRKEYLYVHRLVAEVWCQQPPVEKDLIVHHIDGNRTNNNYLNLVWLTRAQHQHIHDLLVLFHGDNEMIGLLRQLTQALKFFWACEFYYETETVLQQTLFRRFRSGKLRNNELGCALRKVSEIRQDYLLFVGGSPVGTFSSDLPDQTDSVGPESMPPLPGDSLDLSRGNSFKN